MYTMDRNWLLPCKKRIYPGKPQTGGFLEDCVNQEQDFITELYMIRRSYLPTAATGRNLVLSGDKMVRFCRQWGRE